MGQSALCQKTVKQQTPTALNRHRYLAIIDHCLCATVALARLMLITFDYVVMCHISPCVLGGTRRHICSKQMVALPIRTSFEQPKFHN
jgi:hypothetical protein